jgi:hypothetical protein
MREFSGGRVQRFVLEPFHDRLCFPVASFPLTAEACRAILSDFVDAYARLEQFGCTLIPGDVARSVHDVMAGALDFAPPFFAMRLIDDRRGRWPYLVHSDFELPLFLRGTKKLGWLDRYPGMGEFEWFRHECFDRLVDEGLLEKQERLVGEGRGARGQVFYTPPGEAWRVQAYECAKVASARTGGWSAAFEEMLGILMGYTEEENRCWAEDCIRRNVFPSGMRLYCVLTDEEASFVRNAAFRVLPWATSAELLFHDFPPTTRAVFSLVDGRSGGAVVVKVVVPLLAFQAISTRVDHAAYRVAQQRVPELNQMLRGRLEFIHA